MISKTQLRQQLLAKRKTISEQAWYEKSRAMTDNFFMNFHHKLLNTKYISIFLPIYQNKEPNTQLILKTLHERFYQIQIAVPKTNVATKTMQHLLVNQQTEYVNGPFGIPEPKDGQELPAQIFDLILVPLLGYDQTGQRIGYGKGYYDRFLAKINSECITVGLCFEDAPCPTFETLPTDIPLQYIISANSFWKFKT
jgi:5-formyltetrahydrofolate cyclo-ligase